MVLKGHSLIFYDQFKMDLHFILDQVLFINASIFVYFQYLGPLCACCPRVELRSCCWEICFRPIHDQQRFVIEES